MSLGRFGGGSAKLILVTGGAALVAAVGFAGLALLVHSASSEAAASARADRTIVQIERVDRLLTRSANGSHAAQRQLPAALGLLEPLVRGNLARKSLVRALKSAATRTPTPVVRRAIRNGLATLQIAEERVRNDKSAMVRRTDRFAVGVALALVVAMIGLFLAVARWTRQRLERPLAELRVALETLAGRREGVRVRPDGIEEIAELGLAFNSVAERLEERRSGLETAAAQLKLAAHRDPMTGIWNRRRFEDELDRQFNLSRQTRAPLSVLVLDLDRFKEVNDRFGHAAGDALLRRTAAALERSVRRTDVVGRLGGDEFAVILPNADVAAAARIAAAVEAALSATEIIAGSASILPMASVGAATRTATTADGDELLRAADAAMYEAKKRAGRSGPRALAEL